jgi:hypothetical protein
MFVYVFDIFLATYFIYYIIYLILYLHSVFFLLIYNLNYSNVKTILVVRVVHLIKKSSYHSIYVKGNLFRRSMSKGFMYQLKNTLKKT